MRVINAWAALLVGLLVVFALAVPLIGLGIVMRYLSRRCLDGAYLALRLAWWFRGVPAPVDFNRQER